MKSLPFPTPAESPVADLKSTSRPAWLGKKRQALLLSCALASMVALGEAEGAGAQAFQGTFTPTAGNATRTVTGGTTETIIVETPSAVVTWTPTDNAGTGPIDFLPSGHTATFVNGQNTTNFAILNRIIPDDPSRRVDLNGNVISRLQTAAGSVPGGTVAFYTPGGILIGSSAVFDVGNLVLTTIDPVLDQAGNFVVNGRYSLNGAVNPGSSVTIAPGAQISALSELPCRGRAGDQPGRKRTRQGKHRLHRG